MMRRLHDHFPALCRLTLGGNALVSWYNSMVDPASQLFWIGKTHDGGILLWLMGLFGATIVIDVIINDWTPEYLRLGPARIRLAWRRAFQFRHFLFVGLSFCYAAQPFVAERSGNGVSLLMYFYWYALCNLAVAFLDANQRSRSVGWQRACS